MQPQRISIKLLPSQHDFVFSGAQNPAIVGGVGSGKSEAGIARLIRLMVKEPGTNTLYAMPTYDLLNLRAITGFTQTILNMGISFSLNKSNYSMAIHGLGTVYFRSYDNPKRFIAFEVAHSIVDEIDTLSIDKASEVWRKVTERTRQKTKNINTIGAVTTPDHGKQGFTYSKWVKNKTERQELIKAKTTDNIFLPDGYVDQILANYDAKLAELYIDGEFVSLTEQKVYHFYDKEKHHKKAVDYIHYHIGHDFNIGGCCSTVFGIDGSTIHAIDEFVSHDTQDFIFNLNRYKGKQITIYPDSSGGSRSTNADETDIQMIKRAGYKVNATKSNPSIRARINSVNMMLSSDRFFIDTDKCQELSSALEDQGYNSKGEPEKFAKHPAIDDWADSAGYFINRKFPIVKPVYATGIKSII